MSGAELTLRRDPSPVFPEGAFMKTSIVYKIAEGHQPVETEVQRQLIKMEKLLKSYKKDMPQLHVACEKNGRGAEYSFSLNLWLPTGTLHAVGAAATVRAGCKKAFGELERQLRSIRRYCARITNGSANAADCGKRRQAEKFAASRSAGMNRGKWSLRRGAGVSPAKPRELLCFRRGRGSSGWR